MTVGSVSEAQEALKALKSQAHNQGLPFRRTDGKLYALLSGCLKLCEDLLYGGFDLIEEFRDSVRPGLVSEYEGRSRAYLTSDADVFILVARSVLHGVDNRNSTYRYSTILREAHRRGIRSESFGEWAKTNGGLRTLHRSNLDSRPLRRTRVLELAEAVTYPTKGEFTIRLRLGPGGVFRVIHLKHEGADL